MKAKIFIKDFEKKSAINGGTYYKFQTDIGPLTCWKSEVFRELTDPTYDEKMLSVNIEENDKGYKHITKFNGIANNEIDQALKESDEIIATGKEVSERAVLNAKTETIRDKINEGFIELEPVSKKSKFQPTSMYVSYAKDLCKALIERKISLPSGVELNMINENELMDTAILLIKQAHTAFE